MISIWASRKLSLIAFFWIVSLSIANAETAENRLLKSMQYIQKGSFESALPQISELANDKKNYKLVQLMKAELLAIKSGNVALVEKIRRQHRAKSKNLLQEAKVRWQTPTEQQNEILLEKFVLKSNKLSNLVIVNTETNRLYVYKNTEEGYQELANYYVTIGKGGSGKEYQGDMRTPIGVYHIREELLDKNLTELYGVGALTLNYPNQWDKEKGRTGSGIWLHGTPRNNFSRSPLESRGCVVLNNPAMKSLTSNFNLSAETPVIIVKSAPEFLEVGLRERFEKQIVLAQINDWLREQSATKIDWEEVSVFVYPNEKELYYVSFITEKEGKKIRVEKYWRKPFNQLVAK